MTDDSYFQVRINAGMGGYWEAEIIWGDKRSEIRSYKLDSLVAALIEAITEFRRYHG